MLLDFSFESKWEGKIPSASGQPSTMDRICRASGGDNTYTGACRTDAPPKTTFRQKTLPPHLREPA